jgi:MYXO-CTERM domain-containing protein
MVNSTYGPLRMTGDANHVGYVNWLASQLTALPGVTLKRDTYTFKRWSADMIADTGASLNLPGGQVIPLDVLHYYPYTGEGALAGPVTGPIIYLAGDGTPGSALANVTALMAAPPANLANSIVVIESPCSLSPAATLYGSYPADLVPKPASKWQPYQGFAHGNLFDQLDSKCLGIVFCWVDVGDEAARFQYTVFSKPHRQTPALWVGKDTALLLKSFGGTAATITMKLSAKVFPNSPTDTLYATLPGLSSETVVIASHTDGPNICEENGALGVLALATYASQIPLAQRNRTLVFAMVTGHVAGGALSDAATATGPYGKAGADGAGFYRDHPEIVQKAVAAFGIEHLGGMEWADDPTHTYYAATGQVDAENWFVGVPGPTNTAPAAGLQNMANVALSAAQGEPADLLRMQVEKTGQPSPMSGAALAVGIPALGLIPIPSYLLLAGPTGSIEKINPARMYAQIEVLTKMMVVIDKLSADQIKGVAATSATDLDPSQGSSTPVATDDGGGGCTVGNGTDASLPIMAGLAAAGLALQWRRKKISSTVE